MSLKSSLHWSLASLWCGAVGHGFSSHVDELHDADSRDFGSVLHFHGHDMGFSAHTSFYTQGD